MKSISEVAKETGKSTALIRRMCAEGKINAKKIGRNWIIFETTKKVLAKL